MGANVAALYAGTMPERVRALVNLEGFGLVNADPGDAPRRYRKWIEAQTEDQAFSEFDDLGELALHIRKRSPRMSSEAAMFVAGEWAERNADGVVRLRADPRHKLPNPVLYRRAEAEACWRAVAADTMFVIGGESRLAEKLGGAASKMHPDARCVTVDKTGHMLHFEAPAAIAGIIESFLLKTL